MRPYDNREYRYRFDDDTRAEGLVRVAKLLRLPIAPRAARFDLRLFSGGIGIVDQLAIAIPATRDEAVRIAATCGFVAPDPTDDEWLNLLADDEVPVFVAHHRSAFQPDFAAGDALWVEPDSGVNHWNMMWHAGDELAFLGYDQG
jgi:hypothetical protein